MANEQILIVEDDAVIATYLKNTLTKLGYTVPAMVAFGEETVQRAIEVQPDLILMDIQLAGEMDGVQAAEQIHAQRQRRKSRPYGRVKGKATRGLVNASLFPQVLYRPLSIYDQFAQGGDAWTS